MRLLTSYFNSSPRISSPRIPQRLSLSLSLFQPKLVHDTLTFRGGARGFAFQLFLISAIRELSLDVREVTVSNPVPSPL